jgi:hypothetical protein
MVPVNRIPCDNTKRTFATVGGLRDKGQNVSLLQIMVVVDGRKDRSEELPMCIIELSLLFPITLPYDRKATIIPFVVL